MKKNVLLQLILFILVTLIVLIVIYRNHDNDYYENYNRVIQEPDTLKIIELR